MTHRRLPIVDRLLIRTFLTGSEAEFVVGDLTEHYENDLEAGVSSHQARVRLRRQILATSLAWWGPSAVMSRGRRRGLSGQDRRVRMPGSAGNRHEVGRGEVIGIWLQDLRIAVRSLRR